MSNFQEELETKQYSLKDFTILKKKSCAVTIGLT